MANVKQVDWEGVLPFNATDNADMAALLATLNSPVYGLRISYNPEGSYMRPNSESPLGGPPDGQTLMVPYRISGQEAISYDSLDFSEKVIRAIGGTVTRRESEL